jgi:hypothetical protein
MQQLVEFPLRLLAPMPRILKGGDLRFALLPLRRLEQQVVVPLGIERRIEIDQVYRLIDESLAQDVQVVAKIKLIPVSVGHALHSRPKQTGRETLCRGLFTTASAPFVNYFRRSFQTSGSMLLPATIHNASS